MLPTDTFGWVGWRVAAALLITAPVLAADTPLFPVPLHLVRHYEDPIANSSTEVDEYCTGNKIITIAGAKTVIVDYDRHELLEIDRGAATYSVATFDEIARARAIVDKPSPNQKAQTAAARDAWKVTPLGMRGNRAHRAAESFEVATTNVAVELSVDREITLSRAALDALSGASYPNTPTEQQEAIARACARPDVRTTEATSGGAYGLPLDQSTTIHVDSSTQLTIRNSIVKITNELPPPELLAIPAGASLVDSRATRMLKTLKELEQVKKTQTP